MERTPDKHEPGSDLDPNRGPVVHEVVVPDEVVPGVFTPGAELHVEQSQTERHENVSIKQHANASPHSVVIQIAGNARISDDKLGGLAR
jgi:hypothetical protein